MRFLFYLAFCLTGAGFAYSQADTLKFTTRREVADKVFGLLSPAIYGNALLDRSITESGVTMNAVRGQNLAVHSFSSWLDLYSDLSIAYTNQTYMFDDETIFHKLDTLSDTYSDTVDQLVQPFALLLHEVSVIDSAYTDTLNPAFDNFHSQLKLKSGISETNIYRKMWVKSAALLELYGDHGYETGTIAYQPEFISVSPGITINSIRLNTGSGYVNFNSTNNRVNYDAQQDYTVGRVAIDYTFKGSRYYDTISFYLTTETYKYKNNSNTRSVDRWDDKKHFNGNGIDIKYGIKYGCGNGSRIRRPIIIAPPYRPQSQPFSLNKYYDQFDYKSVISSLSDMGYDVLFIKEDPGNKSLETGGAVLAEFLKKINTEKRNNYPDEEWETVVIGYSAGGQQWRYALKLMEKQHMEAGYPHHHTRLYIPFDSPHWGANVPYFAQAVFHEQSTRNPWATLVYNSLTDEASKDMLMYHILENDFNESNDDYSYEPAPTSERTAFVNALQNSFNHQFTPINDLRRSFPSFTRNAAVATGSFYKDYETEYGLYGGRTLFTQNTVLPFMGIYKKNRIVNASHYTSSATAYKTKELKLILFIIPLTYQREYTTRYLPELDLAQGGYKDEFYDKSPYGIPTGALPLLRWSNFFFGQKHYNGHVSFLPLVSALGINPSLWANNNLYYNLQDKQLMHNQFNSTTQSDLYGYPHLAHPNNHFNITPFEALYCDPQTYEHIKLEETIKDNSGMDDAYIVHTRNFILDEVEADVVGLQNKVIGNNHVQWDPNYEYRAWYKAYQAIEIGNHVTPKTDPGDYIIKPSGDITVYAGQSVSIKPGFHAQNGSEFHAFIKSSCSRPQENGYVAGKESFGEKEGKTLLESSFEEFPVTTSKEAEQQLTVSPNPNNGKCKVELPLCTNGGYVISDLNGRVLQNGTLTAEIRELHLQLPKGICYFRWVCKDESRTLKIVVL